MYIKFIIYKARVINI